MKENTNAESNMNKVTARNIAICRDILKEILDFGISQFQIKQLIKLLALELDDRKCMLEICDIIKDYAPLNEEDDKKQLIL